MSRILIISALFALALSGCGRDALDVGGTAAATAGDGGVPRDGALGDAGVGLDAAGGPDAVSSDATPPDAAPRDAQPTDALPADATPPDTGLRDAQPADALPSDATPPDTGFRDAQPADALPSDATPPDVGFRDAQPTDAQPGDATPPDVGFRDAQPTDALPGDATPSDVGFRDAQPGDALPGDALPGDATPDGGTPCAQGCSALDDACNVGVCGPDGLTCVARPRADGTSCSDGNACTTPDLCLLGRCIPGLERDCSALSGLCVVGACNPGTGQCEAIPQAPPGDSCAAPIPLTVLPGEQVQGGNTSCAADDVLLECGASGGRDLVYSATFVETRRIQLTLSNPPMSPATPRGLQVHAGLCGLPPSLMCEAASAGAVAIDEVFAGGTYFFVVDEGAVPPVGDHELLVHVDPHDTCADPSVIDVPAVGLTNTYRGNTRNNTNDFTANCGGNATSADQVYRMVVAQPSTLRLETVPPANGQPQFDTVLHVRSSTCTGAVMPLFCDDDTGAGNLSLLERSFAPGTYFVVVDGFGANQQGEYRLDVTQVPPLTTLVFPDVGDARQPLAGPFATAGQFVEGIRGVALTTARRVQVDLVINNGLTCGQALFRVRLNNADFGTFVVRPGLMMLSQSFTSANGVNSINGRFNIRYELVNAPPMGCGAVELPDGVSTVGLGP